MIGSYDHWHGVTNPQLTQLELEVNFANLKTVTGWTHCKRKLGAMS